MSYSGRYISLKTNKIRGDLRRIIYRSLWERKFMVYCDTNNSIIEWGSEEVIIPYLSPWDGRVHKCGTLVEEEEVQIDVRAEYTISLRNSLRLDELFKQTKIPGFLKPLAKKGIGMLENLQAAEEEYRKRLKNITGGSVDAYSNDWDEKSLGMELKTLEPLGIILTEARQPNLHFPEVGS